MKTETIPCLVTVRSASTRLPSKRFLPFGDGTVLEHVIRRAKHFGLDPIVCTTVEAADDEIAAIARREDVRCFRGSATHKLKRWRDCCRRFDLTAFHSLDADDPFFDGDEVRRSFALLVEGWDMIAPTPSSLAGGASVGYSLGRAVVEKACAIAGEDDALDTEMMWYYVEKAPDLRKTILSETDDMPVRVRLTLDYEEDYWLLASVLRMTGAFAPRAAISDLFRRNPDLYRINWFRNEEWKAGQIAKEI